MSAMAGESGKAAQVLISSHVRTLGKIPLTGHSRLGSQPEDSLDRAFERGEAMERTEIREKVKDIIANVAGLKRQKIGDEDSLRDDLALDSLSLLEIGIDVDYSFQLNLPDERYKEVATLPQMVELIAAR